LRLEVSVLSTLQKLSGIKEVRALELFTDDGQPHMRPRTWVQGASWSPPTPRPPRPAQGAAGALPRPDAVRDQRRATAPWRVAVAQGSHTLWLPVWMHDKVSTCLEITQSRPFSAHKLDVINRRVPQVYQNYQSLLDYSERDALTGLFNRKTFDEQFARATPCPA
jgi:hypothetical protein